MMPKKWRYFLFVSKNHNTMLPENIEKNMYLRCGQGKITLILFPKNTDHLWYFVNITLLWCPKIWKKNMYNKAWRRQNNVLWCSQKKDNLWIFVKITVLWYPQKWKTCTYDVAKAKSNYYDAKKNTDHISFLVTITIF